MAKKQISKNPPINGEEKRNLERGFRVSIPSQWAYIFDDGFFTDVIGNGLFLVIPRKFFKQYQGKVSRLKRDDLERLKTVLGIVNPEENKSQYRVMVPRSQRSRYTMMETVYLYGNIDCVLVSPYRLSSDNLEGYLS
jgi:DNA-binding transcriptional regulator/RsmH inhibitor MraZ